MAHTVVQAPNSNSNNTGDPCLFSLDTTGCTVAVIFVFNPAGTARSGGLPTSQGGTWVQVGTAQQAAASPEVSVEMFYMVNPPVNALIVSIPNTGAGKLYLTFITLTAAAGFTSALDVSTGGNNTSANPSLSLTTTAAGDAVVCCCGGGSDQSPSAFTHTIIGNFDNGLWYNTAGYNLQVSAGAITMTWTVGSDDWGMLMVAFKEVRPTPRIPGTNFSNPGLF
jgi:hypothetical protein